MKSVTIPTFVIALIVASQQSMGAISLSLTSGATTITITDGGPGDMNGAIGEITFIGAVGSWTTNVSTGLDSTNPGQGPGHIDLNGVNTSANPTDSLTVVFSENDMAPAFPGWSVAWGGTLTGGITATGDAFVSSTNNLFETTVAPGTTYLIGSLGPFTAPGFFATASADTPGITDPYSLTARIVLSSANGAASYSGDMQIAPLPEPATLGIWSLIGGIGAVAGWRRSRRKA